MFGKREVQPKTEHPASYPDGETAQDPRENPPQGGCATIPVDPYADIFPVKYRSPVVPATRGGQSNEATLRLMKFIEESIGKPPAPCVDERLIGKEQR